LLEFEKKSHGARTTKKGRQVPNGGGVLGGGGVGGKKRIKLKKKYLPHSHKKNLKTPIHYTKKKKRD